VGSGEGEPEGEPVAEKNVAVGAGDGVPLPDDPPAGDALALVVAGADCEGEGGDEGEPAGEVEPEEDGGDEGEPADEDEPVADGLGEPAVGVGELDAPGVSVAV